MAAASADWEKGTRTSTGLLVTGARYSNWYSRGRAPSSPGSHARASREKEVEVAVPDVGATESVPPLGWRLTTKDTWSKASFPPDVAVRRKVYECPPVSTPDLTTSVSAVAGVRVYWISATSTSPSTVVQL